MAIQTKRDSSVEWFWMLISFVKFHSLKVWLYCNPQTPYETFETVWPFLLDIKMSEATQETIKKLRESVRSSSN